MKSLPQETAFLEIGPGQVAVGEGPFTSFFEPPRDANAFYWNDFDLSDPKPWKVPNTFRMASNVGQWPIEDFPNIEWQPPSLAPFEEAFRAISAGFGNGAKLEKLVPFVTETGRLRSGDLRALASQALEHGNDCSHAYGHWEATSGFIGITPECFLVVRESSLETMALAGTAAPADADRFRNDPKQIREHALVVEGIREALGETVREEAREVLELNGLQHFLTRLRMELTGPVDLNTLIRQLHPTPAVGFLPRTEKVFDLHQQIRARLAPPSSFATPFGCWHEGTFHSVVAIRHLSWTGNEIALPSGCGLIRESELDLEWAELALKRHVVKQFLNL
ncbi:MAG: menaquinone-specific isochorismate synthase [Verrucomicrobiales bacterium]